MTTPTLKLKFKLNGLEFEVEGNHDLVKEHFIDFKKFITSDILSKVNAVLNETQSSTNFLDNLTSLPESNINLNVDYYCQNLPSIQKMLSFKSENEWLLFYAICGTNSGETFFNETLLREKYILSNRFSDNRIKNLSNNIKFLLKKDFAKIQDHSMYSLTAKGINHMSQLLNKQISTDSNDVKLLNVGKFDSNNSNNSNYKVIEKIDFSPSKGVDFHKYLNDYNLNTHSKKILAYIYFLKKDLKVEKVTLNHIYTAFVYLNASVPKSLYQIISDLKNKFNWVEFDSTSNIQISDTGVQMLNEFKY
jgi:hypothetical protein